MICQEETEQAPRARARQLEEVREDAEPETVARVREEARAADRGKVKAQAADRAEAMEAEVREGKTAFLSIIINMPI